MSGLETKKSEKFLKKTRIVSILQLYQKFLKGYCLHKYLLSLTVFSQNANADFEKDCSFF